MQCTHTFEKTSTIINTNHQVCVATSVARRLTKQSLRVQIPYFFFYFVFIFFYYFNEVKEYINPVYQLLHSSSDYKRQYHRWMDLFYTRLRYRYNIVQSCPSRSSCTGFRFDNNLPIKIFLKFFFDNLLKLSQFVKKIASRRQFFDIVRRPLRVGP